MEDQTIDSTTVDKSTTVDQTSTDTGTTDTVEDGTQTKDSATKTEAAAPTFDPQKSYEDLKLNFDKVNKSYSEIRKEFTRRTQHEAELQKKLDTVMEAISKSQEVPIDPEAFIRDLRTQGPKALDAYLQKFIDPLKKDYEGKLSAQSQENLALRCEFGKERRRRDSVNYPDFEKLEPVMQELIDDPKCPVNWNMPVDDCYDALYKLAKDRSAEQAVVEAKKLGRSEAEKELARESATGVASGTRSPGAKELDWSKMTDVDKMRDALVKQFGVADRD